MRQGIARVTGHDKTGEVVEVLIFPGPVLMRLFRNPETDQRTGHSWNLSQDADAERRLTETLANLREEARRWQEELGLRVDSRFVSSH